MRAELEEAREAWLPSEGEAVPEALSEAEAVPAAEPTLEAEAGAEPLGIAFFCGAEASVLGIAFFGVLELGG